MKKSELFELRKRCGDPDALEALARLHGRTEKLIRKYFAV